MLRTIHYLKRHGVWATARRAVLAVSRAFRSSGMVLFCCELDREKLPPEDLPSSITVDRMTGCAQISAEDHEAITSFWNPKLARRNMKERFGKGAALWLIKVEDRLAGYGWTLRGNTIEPHYFPLSANDAHLFDFHVFPFFRGQGLNPLLVGFVLSSLAAERKGRAFIEAAEWNHAQLSSLRKTPFTRFGRARKWTAFQYTVVSWIGNDTCSQTNAERLPRSAGARETPGSL